MLLEMRIENFILIDKVHLNFSDKLNIFTGETGAGKSMIIGGLNVGLGDKTNADMIRVGQDRATVELVFLIEKPEIIEVLDEYGIILEDGLLIVTREIHQSNRSVIRINGRVSTLSVLKAISPFLIDIHGQHAHQTLLYPKHHLTYLDMMGDLDHKLLRDEVKVLYKSIKQVQGELERLKDNNPEFDVDYIQFQLTEIDTLNLSDEDDEPLSKKYAYYKNLEQIQTGISGVLDIISGDHDTNGVKHYLEQSSKVLQDIVTYDEQLEPYVERFNSMLFELEDLQMDIRQYGELIEVDDEALFNVESRINAINELKLKYGKTVTDIMFNRSQLQEKLDAASQRTEIIDAKTNELTNLKTTYVNKSKQLNSKRLEIKGEFERHVMLQLSELNMKESVFEVRFNDSTLNDGEYRLSPEGFDKIEFMISTNPGMPINPLSKIASGGELSRIMLGIKIALASVDTVDTLVFDEVDTGISGSTAVSVAEKIHQITSNYQVLCITHLPQIATMADLHLLLEKTVDQNMTCTNVSVLEDKNQIKEIARMLSGDANSSTAINNAEDMLSQARARKSIS